jgi:hypothetical protein
LVKVVRTYCNLSGETEHLSGLLSGAGRGRRSTSQLLPPSSSIRINVRELSPGVWRARTLYRFPFGKRRQVERIRPGRTGAKASMALLDALVELATPTSGDLRASTRLSTVAERFLSEKTDSGLTAGSVATYQQILRSIIVPYLGHARPSVTQDVDMSRNVGSSAAAEHLERMFGTSSESPSRPIS